MALRIQNTDRAFFTLVEATGHIDSNAFEIQILNSGLKILSNLSATTGSAGRSFPARADVFTNKQMLFKFHRGS